MSRRGGGGGWGGGGRRSKRRGGIGVVGAMGMAVILLPASSLAAAACIPLAGSTMCSAFGKSQISTGDALTGQFPFLRFVSNLTHFDEKFETFTKEEYVTSKFGLLFGCDNVTTSLPNTDEYYARFTSTVLCSRMIQDSRTDCGLTDETAKPLCAESCAQFGRSEQMIVSNPDTCSNARDDAFSIVFSDYTICSPPDSLDQSCILGSDNEYENCGFRDNLLGLCLYCAENSPNSTDTCCYSSGAETKCAGLVLPTFTNLPPITTATTTTTATSTSSASGSDDDELSGGVIAGITIGALVGVGFLVFALLFWWRRRNRYGNQTPIFNHPARGPPSMTFTTVGPVQTGHGYEALTGSRVARMSALEESTSRIDIASSAGSAAPPHISRAIIGAESSSSSEFGLQDSPISRRDRSPQHRPLHPPPRGRNASLSSSSVLMSEGGLTSLVASSEKGSRRFSGSTSEQLPYFRDYYSNEDIHPGDKVSVLWAYAPRAPDEFELERGDMLKVVGIWDDGELYCFV
ncbi:hypothetical protein BZA05DRAFT_405346 [Tricharina praecox]|uniref:uncharacterized protein n=1 Tax=Tricharina praecox TaxID=43433 RepID=UPI00221ED535|nr:uncharacterized protein BZA05DRAFT_405346 [Tricharina praecox]KAI5847596.1 hypothetical protein BZA05DRAFT_405346 [Tricharina praecox]